MKILEIIKFKIVLRSILAAIVPVILYSLIHLIILNLILDTKIKYFNMWSWIILGSLTLIWPLQNVGLFLLFYPLESFIKNKLRKRSPTLKNKDGDIPLIPFSRRGNYAPVENEK